MAARLGGDEFAVLVKGANEAIAMSMGQRLLAAAAAPFDLTFGRVIVTASAGVVQITESMTACDAIRNADIAMYEAKSKGKNRLAFFEEALQQDIASRVRLGIELYGAIEKQEFELHWQPTLNIGTGRTVGMEALVRWQHPERGLLLPAEFINIAEDTGLIVPLGKWVLDQACQQGSKWQPSDLGRQLTISVNVSPRQMLDGHLCRDVKSALAASGLRPTALVLEITERTLMVNSLLVRQQLDELKELGIRLAIDDFGTGYSSLAYLRSFPIEIVKIDQSFVAALDEDEQAVALVHSIISIAEALGLDTIAEGVETATQFETLRRLGCQVAQGHYYCCARPPEELVGFLGEEELFTTDWPASYPSPSCRHGPSLIRARMQQRRDCGQSSPKDAPRPPHRVAVQKGIPGQCQRSRPPTAYVGRRSRRPRRRFRARALCPTEPWHGPEPPPRKSR